MCSAVVKIELLVPVMNTIQTLKLCNHPARHLQKLRPTLKNTSSLSCEYILKARNKAVALMISY